MCSTQQQAFAPNFHVLNPLFVLSGFSFPVSSMPDVLWWMAYVNPLRYFMIVTGGTFLNGIGLDILWPEMLAMAAIAIARVTASILRFRSLSNGPGPPGRVYFDLRQGMTRQFDAFCPRHHFDRRPEMAEATTIAAKNDGNKTQPSAPVARRESRPFERLRSEIDRLFDDFGARPWGSPFRTLFDIEPFWRDHALWGKAPAVDIAETVKEYEITAELPGLERNNVEVNYADGALTIKGQKQDERQDKRENYHLSERNYGSFQRTFRVPASVDTDKIEASFRNGVLTVTLPKTPEARKKERRIEIK